MKRVVVTGLGALTPIGNNVTDFWTNLVKGTSGAAAITRFDASLFRTQLACELKGFNTKDHFDRGTLKRTDPFTQYALVASEEALQDSKLNLETVDPYSIGVIWGSGQGGMTTFEEEVTGYVNGDGSPRFSPFFVPKLITNMASGMISMKYGLKGLNYTCNSACATSNTALMDAYTYIKAGKATVIVSGGSESPITPASIGGFASMKAMSQRNDDPATASRPFDPNRDGFVMGEGAGAIVLEEYEHAKARGAHIYCELAAAAMTSDAYHMTATHPEGEGAQVGMRQALAEAGLQTTDVDYLNMHATSTPVGDISEAKAVVGVFGEQPEHLYLSATKSQTGHLLGAAGAVEAIACIMSIVHNTVPPTINTESIDPELPQGLNLVIGKAVETTVNVAMSNTFGFGGHNAISLFKRFEA